MISIDRGCKAITEFLVKIKADINIKDAVRFMALNPFSFIYFCISICLFQLSLIYLQYGETSFTLALNKGDIDMAIHLLRNGYNISIKNNVCSV
jgi:hypothetical protein